MAWAPATFALLCGFYLFLAGSVGTVEVIAMVVCASLGTALALGLSFVAQEHFTLRPPLRAMLRPLGAALPEFAIVARELITVALKGGGRHHGDFVQQPFDFGTDGPREAGRRAVTLIGVSLAPRTFVVRGERVNGTVLLHGFPPKPTSPDRQWPT